MDKVTHVVVGENFDESQVQEARELYEKPTVTEQWVYNSSKLGKLAPAKPYDPLRSGKLFSNCIFTMDHIDAPDRLKLFAMITLHGGTVQKELDNKITHLLSGEPQTVAIKVAALTKNKLTIITPDWVLECLRQKRLIESETYHPNLLITSSQQTPKITLMPTGVLQEKSMVRNQLQQNIRAQRPIIQTMQHTPQLINEILQSQIQQQQLQEKAKQRAAQASSSNSQSPVLASPLEPMQPSQIVTPQVQTPKVLHPNQSQQVVTTNAQVIAANQANVNNGSIQQQPVQNQVNQTAMPQNNQVHMQRQISQQQIERQKINMISQHLQQSTQNQQQLITQQQFKQFQSNQMMNNTQQPGNATPQMVQNAQPQQFTQINQQNAVQQGQVVTVQHTQQFPGQQMKQIINPGQPQQIVNQGQATQQIINQGQGQQIINQGQTQQIITQGQQQIMNPGQGQQNQQFSQTVSGQTVKTITQQQGGNGSGNNYIQIIKQGQQIIQIQHPEGSPMQQQVLNQQIVQQSQNTSTHMQNVVTNISAQSNMQNVQGNQVMNQQQQPNIVQGQGNRQNIVIINQVQNSQGMNQMNLQNQRFAGIQQVQGQLKNQVGQQQIIHQKIVTSGNEQIMQTQMQGNVNVQQSPQIIQVHQAGGQQQQQQNVVENIMIDQKMQGTPNIVHVQQQQQQQQPSQQSTQGLTQAQAVQQIAQQLQSGSEIISNSMNPQQMNQGGQMNQQMNIIQSPVHQNTPNSGNQSPLVPQSPQWIPQSPTQQAPQSPAVQQQIVQHQIITTNQGNVTPGGQFIRASGQQLGRIYLDAQSSIQFQRMDPTQRQEYLEQLHNKQQQQQQRGVMFQQRANAPNVIGGARPQHHIVIRSQVPPGLTQQQQMQWLQNQRRQIVIRPGAPGQNATGLPQLPQAGQNVAQFQIDPNATPQQQQMQRQHFQRLQQQMQQNQNQKMQSGPPTPNSPRGPGFPPNESIDGIQQQLPMDPNGVSSAKTKTALANMLSSRLGNNGNVAQIAEAPVEQSAAGTLRMMTAQHNAALNVQGMPPGVRTQQEMIVLQQQQQQIQPQIVGGQTIVQAHPQMQQRRSLGNITNAPSGVPIPNSPVIVTTQMPTGPQVMMPQSPGGSMKVQAPFSPGRAPAIPSNRAQFYGHNPNLKLPPDLFLLGCYFLIVEYDETNKDDLPDWKESIKNHGGEIESCYNVKVTHVLCRTQKHGIVMQAIRDNKRCVTVYWLNDITLKKQVLPPWQAIHLPSSGVFGSMRPGMKHIITIMGFENEDRERVKRMVEESGAKLTTYMNRQNTVIVAKRPDQTHRKYMYAKEFNIPVVNLVWLSDLLLGNTSTISQFDSTKYQQYNLQQPLRIDHSVVPQLMSKSTLLLPRLFY